jgi:hypothetical protein
LLHEVRNAVNLARKIQRVPPLENEVDFDALPDKHVGKRLSALGHPSFVSVQVHLFSVIILVDGGT